MAFLFKSFLSSFFLLLGVLCLTFLALRWMPGGPFDGQRAWPKEVKAQLERSYGFDLPIWKQGWKWFVGSVVGDQVHSFQYWDYSVRDIVLKSFPVSAKLGSLALLFALLGGFLLGGLSLWSPWSGLQTVAQWSSKAAVSLPHFLFASLGVIVFGLWWSIFPVALLEGSRSYILPAVALGFRPMGMIARLVQAYLEELEGQLFLKMAFAKGLSPWKVYFKHALRLACVPLLGLLGPLSAHLLTGSFVIEWIFQIPGMGKYFVEAVLNRDYPLVMAVTAVYGVVLVSIHFLLELVLGWLDPRVREHV